MEGIDGLGQKRLETELPHSLGCIPLPVRSDGDSRDTAALRGLESPELLDEPEPVLTGHRQVRHHGVHARSLHNGQGIAGAPRGHDLRTECFERRAEEFERVFIIVHDQDIDACEIDRTKAEWFRLAHWIASILRWDPGAHSRLCASGETLPNAGASSFQPPRLDVGQRYQEPFS